MKESARKIFGKNVHRLRFSLNLTQEKLAEMADINRRFLQRIEAGTANPGIEVISRLKKAFNCEWQELLKGI